MALDWMKATVTQGYGPTDEPLDSGYNGYAHFNKGIDYGLATGTPIDSPVSGTVVAAGDQGDGWGISVKVRDAQGNIHNFGHLDGVNVSAGQTISQGEVVGKSGNSGRSTGPHLSYDVLGKDGTYIDPSPWTGGAATNNARANTAAGLAFGGGKIRDYDEGGHVLGDDGQPTQYTPSDVMDAWVRRYMDELQALSVSSPAVKAYAKENNISPVTALGQMQDQLMAKITSLQTDANSLRDATAGVYTLPNGMAVPTSSLPPETRAMVDESNRQVWTNFQNTYLKDQYDLSGDRATAVFNSQIAGLNQAMGYDSNALSSANSKISRQLQGMAEARARAGFVSDTLERLAPWSTGGKTAFTPADLGAAGVELGKFAGIGANDVAVQFPGSVTIDAADLLRQYDAQMGVGGPLADIPDLLTDPDLVNQAQGGIQNYPGVPSLLNPGAPPAPVANAATRTPYQLPGATGPATATLPKPGAGLPPLGDLLTPWKTFIP